MLSKLYANVLSSLHVSWSQKLAKIDFNSGLGDSAWLLYGLCRSLKPNIAVEIGSARGKSSCYIGMALKHNGSGRLYAVDPHLATSWNDSKTVETHPILCENLKALDLSDVVEVRRSYSNEALASIPKPIDLLFIDGDHSYEGVKADWDNYVPHLSRFGTVVFHDTTWELHRDSKWYRPDVGVPRFMEELRQAGYPIITIDRDCGVSIVQPPIGGVSLQAIE